MDILSKCEEVSCKGMQWRLGGRARLQNEIGRREATTCGSVHSVELSKNGERDVHLEKVTDKRKAPGGKFHSIRNDWHLETCIKTRNRKALRFRP